MKKLYAFLLLSIIILSCGRKTEIPTDLKPIYSDFKNVLQEKNLYGKVKEIGWYKTVYQKDREDDKAILNLREGFTDFGALKEASYYDGQGELTQNDIFEYDNKKFNVRTISKNKPANINYIATRQRDSINKTETSKILINDSLKQEVKVFFNDNGKVIKQVNVDGKDTTITRTSYEFDKAGKIISESRTEGNDTEPTYVDHYKYDKNENLIESSFKAWGSTQIIKIEWKNGQIFKKTQFTISRDLKMHLDEETEYDSLYNPIDLKIYHDSKLNRELKYSYEYDKNGNWIKRNISLKEYFADSKKFTPVYNETRKIKY